jgi:hypothetical protein
MPNNNNTVKLSIKVALTEEQLEVFDDAFSYRAPGCGIRHFIPALVNSLGRYAHIRAIAAEYAAIGGQDSAAPIFEDIETECHGVVLPADELDALAGDIGIPGDLSPERKLESFVQRLLDFLAANPIELERFLEQMIEADSLDELV